MATVELTAAWWAEPTGTGRVKRYRGDVMNITDEAAARLVALGAAKEIRGTPTPADTAPAPQAATQSPEPAPRRKPTAKRTPPAPQRKK